jgi:hypothetical protein
VPPLLNETLLASESLVAVGCPDALQVDPADLTFVGSAFMYVARSAGAVKTVVNREILQAAAIGAVDSESLPWESPTAGRVEKGGVRFYTISVDADDIKAGFAISAACRSGQVKLLVWKPGAGEEFWSIVAQLESIELNGKNITTAFQLRQTIFRSMPESVEVRCQTSMWPLVSQFCV